MKSSKISSLFFIFLLTAVVQTSSLLAVEDELIKESNKEEINTEQNDENLAEIKNLLFSEKNAEDQIQLDLELSHNIVTIGESFFATVTVSYDEGLKVRLPGPFFDWQPFYKNSHKIDPLKIQDGIVTYTITYELSTFDLEPKFFPDISLEYWKKGQAPENPPNILTIKGPSIAIKRIISEEEVPTSTIGDMRSAFVISKHLTEKQYLMLSSGIVLVLIVFALTFLWLRKNKQKKNELFLAKKELSVWEKKIISQNSPSREDLRIFYQKISSIAKKILSLMSSNKAVPSMTAKEMAKASEINSVSENVKESFLNFLKKSEEIKYSIGTIDVGQAVEEIKNFSSFLHKTIYDHKGNLRKRKKHDLV